MTGVSLNLINFIENKFTPKLFEIFISDRNSNWNIPISIKSGKKSQIEFHTQIF